MRSFFCIHTGTVLNGTQDRSSFPREEGSIWSSVVDPNSLNLDPDPEIWPNLDPEPDPGLNDKFLAENKNVKITLEEKPFKKNFVKMNGTGIC